MITNAKTTGQHLGVAHFADYDRTASSTYHRHVLLLLFRTGGFSLLFIGMIYLLLRSIFLIQLVIERTLTPLSMIKILLYAIPELMVICVPWSLLIGTLFVYTQLNSSRVIVSMKAAGMTHWQLARPALDLGLIVLPLVIACSVFLAPWGEQRLRRIIVLDPIENFVTIIRDQQFIRFGRSAMLYAGSIDVENNQLNRVIIFDRLLSGLDILAVAESARISFRDYVLLVNFKKGNLQAITNNSLIADPERLFSSLDEDIRKKWVEVANKLKNENRAPLDVLINFDEYTVAIDPLADANLEEKTLYELSMIDLIKAFSITSPNNEVREIQARATERANRILMVVVISLFCVSVRILWPFSRQGSIIQNILVILVIFVIDALASNLNASESSGTIPMGVSLIPMIITGVCSWIALLVPKAYGYWQYRKVSL